MPTSAGTLVATAEASYHGPRSTSLGQPALRRYHGAPLTPGQVSYPAASCGSAESPAELLARFDAWLLEHGERVGVLLVEPQWGSSAGALPWDGALLKQVVSRAQACGVLVLCDEIMCGLGRHGKGTLFASEALGIQPDAVTFGKAIAAGVYPLTGAVLRRGRGALAAQGLKTSQSHTYAAASIVAMMVATDVLRELPRWFAHAARLGDVARETLCAAVNGRGEGSVVRCRAHGQGLMWGCLFTVDAARCAGGAAARPEIKAGAMAAFKRQCKQHRVWPYFVPVGGFMVTPVMDVSEADWREAMRRLVRCVEATVEEMDAAFARKETRVE